MSRVQLGDGGISNRDYHAGRAPVTGVTASNIVEKEILALQPTPAEIRKAFALIETGMENDRRRRILGPRRVYRLVDLMSVATPYTLDKLRRAGAATPNAA